MKVLRDSCGNIDPGNVKRLSICHRLIEFLPGSIGALLVKVGPTRFAVFFSSLLLLAGITNHANAQEKKKTFAVIHVLLANPSFPAIKRDATQQSAKSG